MQYGWERLSVQQQLRLVHLGTTHWGKALCIAESSLPGLAAVLQQKLPMYACLATACNAHHSISAAARDIAVALQVILCISTREMISCMQLSCRLNLRGILWGIAFTLGSQLLLALLLRTLWAQRAIAALESWLQAVFGISIRRSSGSAGNSMEEDDTDDSVVTAAGPVRTSSSSSIGSSLSAGSTDSSSSGFGGRSRQKKGMA